MTRLSALQRQETLSQLIMLAGRGLAAMAENEELSEETRFASAVALVQGRTMLEAINVDN